MKRKGARTQRRKGRAAFFFATLRLGVSAPSSASRLRPTGRLISFSVIGLLRVEWNAKARGRRVAKGEQSGFIVFFLHRGLAPWRLCADFWIKASPHSLKPIHDSMNSIFHQLLSKVDYQSQLQTRQSQIGQSLSLKHIAVFAGGFAFDDYQTCDDQVDP